ncbi:MAG: SCO family protein [Solirubrobacterales bacterium]
MNKGNWISLALSFLLGGALLTWTTDGLRAFSTEGARRLSVEREPRALPPVVMEDPSGQPVTFSDFTGQWVVVEFIYTRCPTLCQALAASFQKMARDLPPDRLGRDVFLLSVSFDPAHDDRAALAEYGERHQADGRSWRIVRVRDPADLPRLLDTFGIVVIPDGAGGYEHNAALHVVGPDGRLRRIYDLTAGDALIADLRTTR